MFDFEDLELPRQKNFIYIYDLVPKGAQEKRTEVLENKVDRM